MVGGKGYIKRIQQERREEVGKRARIREGGEGEKIRGKTERKGEDLRGSM